MRLRAIAERVREVIIGAAGKAFVTRPKENYLSVTRLYVPFLLYNPGT